jgi:CheY-like chemotaxis protein
MDGVQATRALKADEALQHIPIIVITASAMQSEEAALKPICDGYLRKPISRGDLAGQMRNFCRVKPGHRGAPPVPPTAEPASPARLTELQPHLDGCRETWEALLHAPLVGEVERFGRHLETLGEEYYHPPLRDYGRRLAASAARFDLAEMETTLQGYGALFVDPKISASTPS